MTTTQEKPLTLKSLTHKPEQLTGGHRMCSGCGAPTPARSRTPARVVPFGSSGLAPGRQAGPRCARSGRLMDPCPEILPCVTPAAGLPAISLVTEPSFAWREFVLHSPLTRAPEFFIGVGVGHLYLRDVEANRRRNGDLFAVPAFQAEARGLRYRVQLQDAVIARLIALGRLAESPATP